MNKEVFDKAKRVLDEALNTGYLCTIYSNVLYYGMPGDNIRSEDNSVEWNSILEELYATNEYFVVNIEGVAYEIEKKSDYINDNPNHKLILEYSPSFWHLPPEEQYEESIVIGENYISYKKKWLHPIEENGLALIPPKVNVYCKLDIKPFDKNDILFKLMDAFMKVQNVNVCDGDDLVFYCYRKGKRVKYYIIPCANYDTMVAIKETLAPYLKNMPCPSFLDFDEEEE